MTTPDTGVVAGTRVFVGHSGAHVKVETLKPGDWVLGWNLARATGRARFSYTLYPTEVVAVSASLGKVLELMPLSGRFIRCGVALQWHAYNHPQPQDHPHYLVAQHGLELGLVFKPNLQVDQDTFIPGSRGDYLAGFQTTLFEEQLYSFKTRAGNCVLEGYAARADL